MYFFIREGHYVPDYIAFDCFYPSRSEKNQKFYSNGMKLDNLKKFEYLDNFRVKVKHNFIRNRRLSIQNAYRKTHSVVVAQF